ncbi:MAG TPA: VWA domain-containing protein [Thermoanaerobaculia bacterium]|nr:VWA domain-containing protein [Thermoanaerobaculia bacterium]
MLDSYSLRRSRRLLPFLLSFLIAFPLRAQQPEKLVESIEIRVINVDVMVTDAKGNIVTGLTKDDFILYENRTPQAITNFYEERAVTSTPASRPASPAEDVDAIVEPRTRRVIFFIDNSSIHPFGRNQILVGLEEFAAKTLRSGDEIMVVTWGPGLKVELPFTTNVAAIAPALKRVAAQNTGAASLVNQRRETERRIQNEVDMISVLGVQDCYAAALTHTRFYSEQVRNQVRSMVTALNGVISSLAGQDGKKAVIFSGQALPMYPGIEMFQHTDEAFAPYFGTRGPTSRTEAISRGEGALQESITRTANANGVTFYVVNSRGGQDESETPAERSVPRSDEVRFLEFSNSATSLMKIADSTGGVAVLQPSDYAATFEGIARDFDSYYSLGYRSSSPEAGERDIRVVAKNPAYKVRSRQGLVVQTNEAEIADRVIGNLYREATSSDIILQVSTGRVQKQRRGRFKVPVEVRIPTSAFTLIPQGAELAGGFTVFIGVADQNGNVSEVTHKSQQLRIPAADEKTLRGKHVTFVMDAILRGGENTVSVAVVDDLSRAIGFARASVAAR